MKKAILAFVMFFMMVGTIGYAADSNVYLEQSGSDVGLIVDIYIDGAGSSVGSASGASSTDEEFVVGGGTNNNIDIDIIGGTNYVYGEWINDSTNSAVEDLTINNSGAGIQTRVDVGEDATVTNVRLNQLSSAASNVFTYRIGNSLIACTAGDTGSTIPGAVGADASDVSSCSAVSATSGVAVSGLSVDVDVTSASNLLNITNVTTATNDTLIDVDIATGTANDVDLYAGGTGVHNTSVNIAGASNEILGIQKGAGTTTLTLDVDASSSKINTYQDLTSLNSSTINLDINSAADIDIVITD